jgi:hypothetical protein
MKQPGEVMGTALMSTSTQGHLSPGNPSVQDWIDFCWQGAAAWADIA